MVASILLGLIASFVAVIGMKCMKCMEDDEVKKMRMALLGGVMFLISGEQQHSRWLWNWRLGFSRGEGVGGHEPGRQPPSRELWPQLSWERVVSSRDNSGG